MLLSKCQNHFKIIIENALRPVKHYALLHAMMQIGVWASVGSSESLAAQSATSYQMRLVQLGLAWIMDL
jgi:hypothetical protein